MSGICEEYLLQILGKVADLNHINDWSFNQVKFENIAQNYFGILIPVVLLGRCDGKEVRIDLVLKLAPTNDLYRVSGAVTVMFAKEVFMYSVVLKKYQELQEHIPKDSRFMEIMKDRLNKAMEKFSNTKYTPVICNLRQNCATFFKEAAFSVQNTCICHGDIWKENILYKYEDHKPVSACIIDYQTARICSPAFDAMYLIISSTNTELRNHYFHQLLDTYYQTFEKILKVFGLETQEIYSREMFDNDLKVVSPSCLITANTALWLLNGLQEVGHVRSKQVLNTTEEKEIAINRYKGIVKAMIDDLSKFGYLSSEIWEFKEHTEK